MIKVKNNIATREQIPDFLVGLAPESLADLSWTDPALGVQDCKWLPEQDVSSVLEQFEVYNGETLTVDNNVVFVERTVVPMTQEQIEEILAQKMQVLQTEIVNATQQRLDTFTKTHNYDGILSACTYSTSTVPRFKAEGQYCVNARDSTWSKLYEILAEVQSGIRPVPAGYADIEDDLPVLLWPTT